MYRSVFISKSRIIYACLLLPRHDFTSEIWCLRRYGMKGPVYLKNRDGQVLSAGQDGGCEWQSGSVHRYSDRITTTSLIGTTTFTLFSHITVSVPAVVLTGLHC